MNNLTFYSDERNTMMRRRDLRSQRMQKNSSTQSKKTAQKQFRLVCIFPENTTDEENVKRDVKNILSLELQHQLQQM